MSLPISRSALDKLGKRLAAGVEDEADWAAFREVIGCYQAALNETNGRLTSMGLHPTGRTKSTGTLLDKVARGTSLKSLQDLAGTRLVLDGGLDEQDEVRDAIMIRFEDGERPPKCKDRREEPMHGYRAVHVVVTVQGLPVEVQIRTQWQHMWAEVTEALGDKWGRSLRYHEKFAGSEILASNNITRGAFVEQWRNLSLSIATIEEFERKPNYVDTEFVDLKDTLTVALQDAKTMVDGL